MAGEGKENHGPADDELLRVVFESAVDFAIIALDPGGLVTRWNAGAEQLLGYAAKDIIGRSGDVLFTEEDRAAGAPEHEQREAAEKGRAEDERWHLKLDGSRFWGSGILMPLTNDGGFVKIMRDLTEKRMAEDRVRKSEELFRVLATNIPNLVFRTRTDGERTWGSPQWIIFTGVSFEDSLRYGWLDAVHPDDRDATLAAWEAARAAGEYHVEHRIRRAADGDYRWHQTRARPVDGGANGDDWVGTSTDIHDMRELQERQLVLLGELQHRTRNLLAVVHSVARQTMRASSSLETFAVEFEGRLRALSRVQSLLARVEHESVDLREIVEAELHAHGDGQLETGKIRIDGPPVLLPANSVQALALGIHELATNAVKYGALAQADGRLSVGWRIDETGGSARRAIFDWSESGVDMSNAHRERRGYGSELITRALPYQLHAETKLDFGEDGVSCRIVVPIAKGEARP